MMSAAPFDFMSFSRLSVDSIKRQYFLLFALTGSLTPFLSVLLKQKGLGEAQIGSAIAASNIAVMLTPGILALLADSRLDSRRIMAVVFTISSAAVIGLNFVHSF